MHQAVAEPQKVKQKVQVFFFSISFWQIKIFCFIARGFYKIPHEKNVQHCNLSFLTRSVRNGLTWSNGDFTVEANWTVWNLNWHFSQTTAIMITMLQLYLWKWGYILGWKLIAGYLVGTIPLFFPDELCQFFWHRATKMRR